jgi:hypothetical protein
MTGGFRDADQDGATNPGNKHLRAVIQGVFGETARQKVVRPFNTQKCAPRNV